MDETLQKLKRNFEDDPNNPENLKRLLSHHRRLNKTPKLSLLDSWLKDLESGDREIVKMRLEAFTLLGPLAEFAVKEIFDAYCSVRFSLRNEFGSVFNKIGYGATGILMMVLGGKDSNLRGAAAEMLGRMTEMAKIAILALILVLQDEDSKVRGYAAQTLWKMGKEAIPALIQALQDKDSKVRRYAAEFLGSLGVEAKIAIPALTQVLQDNDADVREAAVEALGNIGEEAIPALTEALQDKDSYIRWTVVGALGKMGVETIDTVSGALQDEDWCVRTRAAEELEDIGSEAKVAIPALTQALQDIDSPICQHNLRHLQLLSYCRSRRSSHEFKEEEKIFDEEVETSQALKQWHRQARAASTALP